MPISVFLRQHLYFGTRNCVSICTSCGFREVRHASQRVSYMSGYAYAGTYEAHAI
jgi:hypothetical protein